MGRPNRPRDARDARDARDGRDGIVAMVTKPGVLWLLGSVAYSPNPGEPGK